MGSVIAGCGVAVPPHVVTNDDLARVMDTTDEWIVSRSGVRQRHFAAPGVGSSALGAQAVNAALANAGVEASDVDLLVAATMTPDAYAPGNAPLIQHAAGLGPIAAFDIRQQCGGFLYGLDLADAMLRAGRATCAVVVGAEVHAGYLPFGPSQWGILRGTHTGPVDADEYSAASEHRAWAVLFGDGAGAMVLRPGADNDGFLSTHLGSDGALFDLIHVPGMGFVHQPYVDAAQLEAGLHHPHMNGMELFRQAVRLMPDSVQRATAAIGATPDDLDLLLAHQANERIVAGVAKQLGLPSERVPTNIARYGNTTAATMPLLWHDLMSDGRIEPGNLIGFTAFGAGAHWGAMTYRVPRRTVETFGV